MQALSDEQLQELSSEQLAAAADAAAAACHAAAGATGNEVGECLLDYFVFKRCMQLMLLQRQHRRLVQQHHLSHQQQQQQPSPAENEPDGSSSSSSSSVPAVSPEELAEVDIWDAFFDADLDDYIQYLQAAAAGAPSVFTTINPNAQPQQQQQQPQGLTSHKPSKASRKTVESSAAASQQQQLAEARQLLSNSAAMLSIMPPGIKSRPLLLLGSSQLVQLAAMAGGSPEDVVEVLQDFYKLKRLGFRAALEELMDVADEQSVVERFQA
ncbi:hypothetical protein OEZ85_011154 [Tetradesmus obliquus]|uniref:Uncharacterized protein n=1 Tax=Tetradesmus obliquus TaxID=3088 RepID=A0ABY8TRM1_TETOB|nr:hypothetical protein OEZ85_011154 [Tetradesmus obliquus]